MWTGESFCVVHGLRRFLPTTAGRRPNRRHIWSGLYLPGVTSEGVGQVAIAVDCSGSIHARQLGLFEAEVTFDPCRSATTAGSRALLRCRSASPRDVPGRPANPPDPSRRWRHGFSPMLPLAERKRNLSADARLSDRPLRHIPRDGARLPGDLGVDRDEASPVRASDSHGSGVSPRKPDIES